MHATIQDLLDSRPSHFIPLSFRRAVWRAPGLLRWCTSYWTVYVQQGVQTSYGCGPLFARCRKIAAISFLALLYPLPLGKVCLHLLACKSCLVFVIPPCSITLGSIIWTFNLRCSGFSASRYAHFGSSILQSFRFWCSRQSLCCFIVFNVQNWAVKCWTFA